MTKKKARSAAPGPLPELTSGPSGGPSSGPARGVEDEEDVADEVFEFVRAIDHFKRTHNRPFPTWSEVLGVLKGLGYERRAG